MPSDPPSRIDLFRVVVPLVTPFESAHGIETERRSILVRAVDADGAEGWGECPALAAPTYTGEWHDGAWTVLADHLAPVAVAGRPSPVRGHPMASSALEGALIDLELGRQGRSLAEAIGVQRRAVASCRVVGVADTIDQTVVRVGQLVDAGVNAVKLKIRPGSDLGPLRAVRAIWPHLWLAADANGSYAGAGPADLRPFDRLELWYLEQPHAPDDLVAAAELSRALTTPIALDESAVNAATVRTALALGWSGPLNLKPARLGGVLPSLELHQLAVDQNLLAWCGGMLELGVGRATALAVAGLRRCVLPTDLGPSAAYVPADVTEPIEANADGSLTIPRRFGIGRHPLPERLDEVVVERRTIGG